MQGENRVENEAKNRGSDSEGEAKKKKKKSNSNKSRKSKIAHPILFGIVAAIVSVVPCYLYSTVFDMSFSDFGLWFAPCVLASTVLLTYAYYLINQHTYVSFSQQRKNAGQRDFKKLGYSSIEKMEAAKEKTIVSESLYYSLVFNNVVYVTLYLFLAFYVLREIYLPWNYVISQVGSALAVWQLAASFSK